MPTKIRTPRPGSLQRSFLWALSLVSLLTAGATFAVFYTSVTELCLRYIQRFALSQNELEKQTILSTVNRELVLSQKLVDDPALQAWMNHETDPSLEQEAQAQLESYRRVYRDHTYFVAVASSRNYYARSPQTKGQEKTVLHSDNPQDRWFFDSLSRKQNFWINVNYDALLGEVRVWINALVQNDYEVLGLAGAGMDLGPFLETLVDHKEPGITTIVVDAQGRILAHGDRSIIQHNARVTQDADKIDLAALFPLPADRQRLQAVLARLASPSGPGAETLRLTSAGRTVVAAVGSLPELGWFNLVLVDGDQVIGWLDFLPVALVFLISLGLILVLVEVLLGRRVLRPLARLNEAAGTVAGGAYEINLPVGRDNEIGRLSASFNRMSVKIRDYTVNLEQLVEERTRDLEASRKRILDSIQYGRLIQNSILPSPRDLVAHLGGYCLLSRPLDTVGGDFCFFHTLPEGFCIAAIDCTGHGVPGAFMTMMVNALLHQLVETRSGEGAAALLGHLHRLVQDTLRAETEMTHLQNGLDIGLCLVFPRTGELEFAGAGLPLFVVEGERVTEVPGDRAHLGFGVQRKELKLHSHRVPLGARTKFFLPTDGILDLPGGSFGFGLGRRGLLELLKAHAPEPWETLEKRLTAALDGYRAGHDAKDDLLLVGFTPKLTEET